jgi:hypothetical protein
MKSNVTYSKSSGITSNGNWISLTPLPVTTKDIDKRTLLPKSVDVLDDRSITFKWEDGDVITVVCDPEDTFSLDVGYDIALTYKIFGGKREFKDRWLKKIVKMAKFHYTDTNVKADRLLTKGRLVKKLKKAKVK